MKKIILFILIIWTCLFTTDYICIKKSNNPIFMIKSSLKDGGTKIYYGLGYKLIKYNTVGDNRSVFGTLFIKYSPIMSESYKFTNEYTDVPNDNMFVYKNSKEIINILKEGTGFLYIGFPECPWCQAYVKYLYEVGKKENLSKIYYYNIFEDRKNKTDDYKQIVSLLNDYLSFDDEGNKKVFVPTIIAIKKGQIIGYDDETSLDTKEYDTPEEYWKKEGTNHLKEKLEGMIKLINIGVCTDCNK